MSSSYSLNKRPFCSSSTSEMAQNQPKQCSIDIQPHSTCDLEAKQAKLPGAQSHLQLEAEWTLVEATSTCVICWTLSLLSSTC